MARLATRRRTGRWASGLGALTAALAACGGATPAAAPISSPPPTATADPLTVVAAAAHYTEAARTARISGSMSERFDGVRLPHVRTPVSFHVSADFAGVVRRYPIGARLTLTNVTTDSFEADRIDELVTPTAIYLQTPALQQQTHKRWFGVGFRAMRSAGLDVRQLLDQEEQAQPAQYVSQLTEAGNLHLVDVESVDGVGTRHYSGSVPIADALDRLRPALRQEFAQIEAAAGIATVQVDAWVDPGGDVRRVAVAERGTAAALTIQIDVLAYNVPVDVTAPPADQVFLAR